MIRGDKIILRAVRESDLDALFDLWSDLELRGENYPMFLPSQVEFRKRFEEHGLLEENRGTLAVCVGDRVAGVINFYPVLYYAGFELGYILFHQEDRNRGYMTEAVQLLSRYLFATKTINRLQIAAFPENAASKRVALKCGFTFEGTLRGAVFNGGRYRDVELYSLLRSETGSAGGQCEQPR